MHIVEPTVGPLLVFVHLGKNPAPTLIQNAYLAKRNLTTGELVLVTDNPEDWKGFPGNVLDYIRDLHRESIIDWLTREYPEYKQIGNGYWIYTLERIFALSRVFLDYEMDRRLIHIESDVASFLDEGMINKVFQKYTGVAVPRYSAKEGVASIVTSSSGYVLTETLKRLSVLILEHKNWITDMELLGLGLNSGILQELPTASGGTQSFKMFFQGEELEILFDALSLGQFFGGLDPVHSNGRAVSGYLSPHLPFPIEDFKWSLFESEGQVALTIQNHDNKFILANLHMHSKRQHHNSATIDMWKQLILEANLLSPRIVGPYIEDLIHTSPVSLVNRFRLLKRRGVLYLIKELRSRILGRKNHS
jgi:hypothetical protein